MAGLFGDPLEQYGGVIANAATVYTTPPTTLVAAAGRFGGYALRAGNNTNQGHLWALPGARVTTTHGASVKQNGFNGMTPGFATAILIWYDGTTVQCALHALSDGSIVATRGIATVIGTASAAGVYALNAWQRFEGQATINNTTGAMAAQVNGVTVLTLTGLNNRASAANQATHLAFLTRPVSTSIAGIDWCDYMVTDSTGTDNTGFLGDKRLYVTVPAGAGTYQTSDAPVGAATRALAAASNDGDTSYSPFSAAGQANTYVGNALPAGVTGIVAVQQWSVLRKDDAGTNTARQMLRSGTTDSEGSDLALNTTFTYYQRIVERDPATAATWTVSGVDAAQFGTKRVA